MTYPMGLITLCLTLFVAILGPPVWGYILGAWIRKRKLAPDMSYMGVVTIIMAVIFSLIFLT